MKAHHIFSLSIFIVIVLGGLLFALSGPSIEYTDELTGTWYGGGTNSAGLDWWMQYTFEDGLYELTTGTDYTEKGSYSINERFLDGSMIVEKIFSNGEKTHEMAVVIPENDSSYIKVEGQRLDRVE